MTFRNFCLLLGVAICVLAAPTLEAQTFGELLRALQKRKMLVEERNQAFWQMDHVRWIKYHPSLNYPNNYQISHDRPLVPIDWGSSLSPYPSDAAADGLSLDAKFEVLKKANRELNFLLDGVYGGGGDNEPIEPIPYAVANEGFPSGGTNFHFLDMRKIKSGYGLIEPLRLDPLDSARSVEDFGAMVSTLAQRIRRLDAINWNIAWEVETFQGGRHDESLPEPASVEWSFSEPKTKQTTISSVFSVGGDWSSGWIEEDPEAEIPERHKWQTARIHTMQTKTPASFGGTLEMFSDFNYAVTVFPDLPWPEGGLPNQKLIEAGNKRWRSGEEPLPKNVMVPIDPPPGFFGNPIDLIVNGEWRDDEGNHKKKGVWLDYVLSYPKYSASSQLMRDFVDEQFSGGSGGGDDPGDEGWRDTIVWNMLVDTSGTPGAGSLASRVVFRPDFTENGPEFASEVPPPPVPPSDLPFVPNLADSELRIPLDHSLQGECALVWRFGTGALGARRVLDVVGMGDWDAVYSGGVLDREEEYEWQGGRWTPNKRWQSFDSYIAEWWRPVLKQLVTKDYAIQIKQGDESGAPSDFKYIIRFFRADQIGPKSAQTGEYAFPPSAEAGSASPFRTIIVETPEADHEVAGHVQLKIKQLGVPDVVYDLKFEQEFSQTAGLLFSTWELTAPPISGTLFNQTVKVTPPDPTEGKLLTVENWTKVDGVDLPKTTTKYLGSKVRADAIKEIKEESSGEGTRTTTYTYHNDQPGELTEINQTGGVNPCKVEFNHPSGLIKKWATADNSRSITWVYNGYEVKRTEKLGNSTLRETTTTYSQNMTSATTLSLGAAAGSLSSILERYPGNSPDAPPWSLKMARGHDGSITTYTYDPDIGGGLYALAAKSRPGNDGDATTVGAGTRTLTKLTQRGQIASWEQFDIGSNAKLDWMIASQNVLFPTSYSRPGGRTESYSYDDMGRVTGHTDVYGKSATFERDALGRIVQINREGATGGLLRWDTTYNPGYLGSRTECSGQIWEEERKPFGTYARQEVKGSAPEHILTERWEDSSQITEDTTNETTHQDVHNYYLKSTDLELQWGNAVGISGSATWKSSWSAFNGGQLTRRVEVLGATGLLWNFTYDGNGLLLTEISPHPNGAGLASRSYTYANGRVASVNDGDGTTSYEWHGDGSFKKATRGARTLEILQTGSATGITREWVASARSGTTTVWKQVFHAPTSTLVGRMEDFPWGKDDRKITTSTAISGGQLQETTEGPAALNENEVRSWIEGVLPTSVSGESGNMTFDHQVSVDDFGRPTQATFTAGVGNTTTLGSFDALGYPGSLTSPGNLSSATLGRSFTSTGVATASLERGGKTSTEVRAANGILNSTAGYGQPPQSWGTPALGSTIDRTLQTGSFSAVQQWNPAGTKKSNTFFNSSSEIFGYTQGGAFKSRVTAAGVATSVEPNAFGEPTVMKVGGTTWWSYTWDDAGDLQTVADSLTGMTAHMTYQEGQPKKDSYTGGPLAGQEIDRSYDDLGRLTTVKPSNGPTITYVYDGPNGSLGHITTAGGASGHWTGPDSVTGRLKTFTLGSSPQLTASFQIDGLGRVSSQSNTMGAVSASFSYGYNGLGQCDSWTTPLGTWSLGYNPSTGWLNSATRGSVSKSYAFDTSGAPPGSTDQRPGTRINSTAVVIAGSVNPAASVTIKRNNGAPTTPTMSGGAFSASFPGLSGWQSFTITGRIAQAGINGSDAVAEEVREVFVPPASETLQYAGSAGTRTQDAVWQYTWDELDRLTRMTEFTIPPSRPALQLDFKYDWQGRRIEKKVSEASSGAVKKRVTYLYDGWRLLREIEFNGAGTEVARRIYTWGPDVSGSLDGAHGVGGLIEVLETRLSQNKRYVPLQDGKGSVVGLVDGASGQRVATFDHGPFGETLGASGSKAGSCPLRFQTRYQDEETGLYYFGKRYYDARSQSFLSRDPLRTLPLYGYANNQPLNYIDPLGLKSIADYETDIRRYRQEKAKALADFDLANPGARMSRSRSNAGRGFDASIASANYQISKIRDTARNMGEWSGGAVDPKFLDDESETYADFNRGLFFYNLNREVLLTVAGGAVGKGVSLGVRAFQGARGAVAAQRTVAAAKVTAGGPAFEGALYSPQKLQQLTGYLERRGVQMMETTGNPAFIARADGTGTMMLPRNPTVLQVKHELSHYVDFRNLGFEGYKNLGRAGREMSVLDRLMWNRSWEQMNAAERAFSIKYATEIK